MLPAGRVPANTLFGVFTKLMNKSKDKHPSRRDMIEAVESGQVPFQRHLQHCQPCRELFGLLHDAAFQSMVDAEEPTDDLLTSCLRIPLLAGARHPARSRSGAITSDSWRELPAVALRDAATGLERRLRLTSGGLVLELVAERRPDEWSFSARVYEGNEVASARYVLQAGRRKIVAGRRDVFVWSSPRPPRMIRLLSKTVKIDFEKIDWKAVVE